MTFEIHTTGDSLTFSVYVQPRASAAAFAGVHLDAIKIKLTAPPAGNAANRQCCQVLAKALSVPKSAVEIIAGHSSRHKRIRVTAGGGPSAMEALCGRIRDLAR